MIGRVFKWTRRLVFLAVASVVLLFLFKDSIQRSIVESRIRSETGMGVKIGRYSSSLLSPIVIIEDLKLYNTAEFGGTLFLDVPELRLEVDPVALARRRLKVTLLRLDLAELNVVRNEVGRTNLFSFKNPSRAQTFQTILPRKLTGEFEFAGVDVLNLSLGRARYIDLKNSRHNREIHADLRNQIFKDVKSEADFQGILAILWLRSGGGPGTPEGPKREGIYQKVEPAGKTNSPPRR